MLSLVPEKNHSTSEFIAYLEDLSIVENFVVSTQHYDDLKNRAERLDMLILYFEGGMLLVDEYTASNKQIIMDKYIRDTLSSNVHVSSVRIVKNDELQELVRTHTRNVIDEMDVEISQAESIKMFDVVMSNAHALKANDVYIRLSKSDNTAFCMFKVEGEFVAQQLSLRDYLFGKAICAALYDGKESEGQSSGNFDEAITPQETQFTHTVYDAHGQQIGKYTIRFAKSKTSKPGELLVQLRLIPLDHILRLNELGLSSNAFNAISRRMRKSKGAVITSGPTGSGKNTTMFAALLEYPKTKSIQTFEDPIEIRVPREYPHIIQNTLDHILGSHQQLKAILRQAPDGIYVTETRDPETADFVFHIAKSGHFVMSTVHANNAVGIIDRLIDLGVSRADLASPGAIGLLMAQRLVRKLCPTCKISFSKANKNLKEQKLLELSDLSAFDEKNVFFRNTKGCDHCRHSGEKGRVLVLEYIEMNEADRKYIIDDDVLGWEAHLLNNGFVSISQQLDDLVNQGIIDVARAVEHFE